MVKDHACKLKALTKTLPLGIHVPVVASNGLSICIHHAHARMHTHKHAHEHTQTHACTHTHTNTRMHTHMHQFLFTGVQFHDERDDDQLKDFRHGLLVFLYEDSPFFS